MKSNFENCCIVNFATGKYVEGQNRLRNSLLNSGYNGSFLFFSDNDSNRFPKQDDSPWGFKPLIIQEAIKKGYKYILWLDSNMICLRKPKTIFKKIKNFGFYISSSFTHDMGTWCSDLALETFNISREQSFHIFEVNPSYVGINASNSNAMNLLNDWANFALDGKTFRGISKEFPLAETNRNFNHLVSKDDRVKGHRHDQTALSFLCWKYNIKLSFCEIKNIQSKQLDGSNKYSKAISFEVEIVQNRDIKSDSYLLTYDKYGNNTGLKKIKFIILSIIETIRRRVMYLENNTKKI